MQVSDSTAPRRAKLVNITRDFAREHTDVGVFINAKRLGPHGYQKLLLNSTFTLCPGGHNAETFRMYEALEAG